MAKDVHACLAGILAAQGGLSGETPPLPPELPPPHCSAASAAPLLLCRLRTHPSLPLRCTAAEAQAVEQLGEMTRAGRYVRDIWS